MGCAFGGGLLVAFSIGVALNGRPFRRAQHIDPIDVKTGAATLAGETGSDSAVSAVSATMTGSQIFDLDETGVLWAGENGYRDTVTDDDVETTPPTGTTLARSGRNRPRPRSARSVRLAG